MQAALTAGRTGRRSRRCAPPPRFRQPHDSPDPSSRGVCSRWRTTIASSSRFGAAAKLPSRWPSNAIRRPSWGSAGTCSDRSWRPRTRCSRPSPPPTTISCATPSGRPCSSRGCSQSRETAASTCCGPGASSRWTMLSGPRTALSEQVEQRDELRQLLADLGEVPHEQRAALLLAELGDLSHAEIAGVLGCEVPRVKALVFRARNSLIQRREARDVSCIEIQEQLANLRGGSLRRNELRLHLRECSACSAYREQVKHQRRLLAAALPVAPSLGLKSSVFAAIGIGGGSAGGRGWPHLGWRRIRYRDADQGSHRGSAGGRGCGCHAGARGLGSRQQRSEANGPGKAERIASRAGRGRRTRPGRAESGRRSGVAGDRYARPEGRAAGACQTRGHGGPRGSGGRRAPAEQE